MTTQPMVALAPQQLFSAVLLRGATVPADISSAVIDASISLDSTQVSQLDITFNDDNFDILRKGYFGKGTPVDFLDLRLVVASINTQASSANKGQVTLQCRPVAVQQLKNRKGALVMRHVSPSQFVEAECAAIHAQCVVQDSTTRTSIARDVYVPGQNNTDSSSWTTFQRLAQEEGFLCWESGGVIYFGRPSWFMQTGTVVKVIYSNDPASTSPYLAASVPSLSTSLDSVTDDRQVDVAVPLERAVNFRPGFVLQLQGCGMFDANYFIQSVQYPLVYGSSNGQKANITGVVPIDPTPQKTNSMGTGNDYSGIIDGVTSSLSNDASYSKYVTNPDGTPTAGTPGKPYTNGGAGGHLL